MTSFGARTTRSRMDEYSLAALQHMMYHPAYNVNAALYAHHLQQGEQPPGGAGGHSQRPIIVCDTDEFSVLS